MASRFKITNFKLKQVLAQFIVPVFVTLTIGCGRNDKGAQTPPTGKPGAGDSQKPGASNAKSCADFYRLQAGSEVFAFASTSLPALDKKIELLNASLKQGLPIVSFWKQSKSLDPASEYDHLLIEKARKAGPGHQEILMTEVSKVEVTVKYQHRFAGLPLQILTQNLSIVGSLQAGDCSLKPTGVVSIEFAVDHLFEKMVATGKVYNFSGPISEVDMKNEWALEAKVGYFTLPLGLVTSKSLSALSSPSTRIFRDPYSKIFKSQLVREGALNMPDPATAVRLNFLKYKLAASPDFSSLKSEAYEETYYISDNPKAIAISDSSKILVYLPESQWPRHSL